MMVESTQWNSILMEHVLQVEAKISLSKFGILEVKGLSNIMMHIVAKLMKLIFTQMVDIYCLAAMIQLWKFGI